MHKAMRTEVSFKTGGPAKPVILLPAFVNGRGPYDFALDTGASLCVLSAELAVNLGIKSANTHTGMGAGGSVQVSIASVDSLAVGETALENLHVAITDLGALGQAAGVKLDGIIGYNFLKSFRVGIDYPRHLLRLD